MPVGINQPSNQIKFTNVSVVRLKKGKKRFELACYKNKLLEYRSGAETDLDNVLQVPTVFLSVSKAQTAPTAELAKAFGTNAKREDIVQEILRKGEVQVGERERKELLERVEREVLEIVSARLVDPVSKRVYTTGMISKALDQLSAASGQQGGKPKGGVETPSETPSRSETGTPVPPSEESTSQHRKPLWTGVVTTKSAKSQALDAMKALISWQPIPVMRARMRLRITCPTSVLKQAARSTANTSGAAGGGAAQKSNKGKGKKGKKGDDNDDEGRDIGGVQGPSAGTGTVKDRILGYFEQVESQEMLGKDEWEVVGFAEPGAFKALGDFVGGETKGRGRVEVLDMAVTHEE
ncbi:hypothetical protein DIZ76_010078 [Coccidioides immitis]|nr:hypothetical protein DIZ76_010078 [Coccidioides immitis]